MENEAAKDIKACHHEKSIECCPKKISEPESQTQTTKEKE
jgi:hypothetical protein